MIGFGVRVERELRRLMMCGDGRNILGFWDEEMVLGLD